MLAELLHTLAAPDVALRLGRFTTLETALLGVALVTAISSAAGLWRISISEDRQTRLKVLQQAAAAREGASDEEESRPSRRGSRLRAMLLESPVVKLAGREQLQAALTTAGYRGEHGRAIAIGCKIGGAVGLPALCWWLGLAANAPLLWWTLMILCTLIGFFAPEFVLARQAGWRRQRLEQAIPDVLDLLVLCAEAGLAMQPAVDEVAQTMQRASPEIAAEFAITGAELRVLPDRATALENLARRTGIESLRGVITTLNQSMRFGTSLSESLRVLSAEMRTARIAALEEGAARLPVLLAIPLMIFLMPALLIVIMSPVALKVIDVIAQTRAGN